MGDIKHHIINTDTKSIWKILGSIPDPEVPALSIVDLGIVRDIKNFPSADGGIEIIITPTYSGCPAMDMININIRMALLQNGFQNIKITSILSPPWTTDWMTEHGKQKLKAFGIAPPTIKQQVCHTELFHNEEAIQCPRCNSYHTKLISQFGSTACKALYVCEDCKEPFDYFKCH